MILKIGLKFVKNFVLKYFKTSALEKIFIVFLEEIVTRTDNTIDDRVFEILFKGGNNGDR